MARSEYIKFKRIALSSAFLLIALSAPALFDPDHTYAAPAPGEIEEAVTAEGEAVKKIASEEKAEEPSRGETLYLGLCATCHGSKGKGDGYANTFIRPKARDFTSGLFKFKTTPPGQPPTDEDLIRVTEKGNPGTAMPPYGSKLSDDDVMMIISYIKEKIAPDVFKAETTPYEIGDPPEATPEIIESGRQLYAKGDCADCHGLKGRGDGELADGDMKDAWEDRIYPTDLTHGWELRNLNTVKDIFRSITAGLDGTPMSSYASDYSEAERWALAYYLKSIQIERKLSTITTVKKVEKIPSSTADPAWEGLDYTDISVKGKKIFGQSLIPMITNIRFRGMHDGSKMALMVEWDDRVQNRGKKTPEDAETYRPADIIALRFPAIIPGGSPWVDKGDRRIVLDIWEWSMADNSISEYTGRGVIRNNKKKKNVKSISSYEDGQYRVIFIRDIKAKGKADMKFNVGENFVYSILINDGENLEKGQHGGATSNQHFRLE